MSIKTWFPTFVYYKPLQSKSLQKYNQELEQECYLLRDSDVAGQKWSAKKYVGGYTSYSSLSELHEMSSTFMTLREKIDQHVYAFTKHLDMDISKDCLKMSSCWVNIMPAQTTHSMHIHPLSVISGTYYVKVPKDAAGIKFEDPRLDKFMAAPPKKKGHKDCNRQIVEYAVAPGNVVLFESWLRHEVPASMAKDNRISISFNYDWVE